jgi:hypothetical protein
MYQCCQITYIPFGVVRLCCNLRKEMDLLFNSGLKKDPLTNRLFKKIKRRDIKIYILCR